MPRIAAAAVNEAIRQLAKVDLSPRAAAALEAFLVAKRLDAKGDKPTIAPVNDVVSEIFAVLPDHEEGRIQPFNRASGGSVLPKWGVVKDSGRKTVWNTTTRDPRTQAAQLFKGGNIRNGLKKDASANLAASLTATQRPNADALKVFLLRNEVFEAVPSQKALDERLQTVFGLTSDDIEAICRKSPLTTPLVSTKDSPEWSPDKLDDDLKPPSVPAKFAGGLRVESDAPLVLDDRVRRMVKLAILSSPAVILVGPPGTGKTALLHQVIQDIAEDPEAFGFSKKTFKDPYWATPEEGWTTRDLVGGETLDNGKIRFRPGWVLQAISQDSWLVLDEANRADLDKIFGGLLTWLSGKSVKLGRVSTELGAGVVELGWGDEAESHSQGEEALGGKIGTDVKFLAGTEWRLLGTYNALDAQRVFRFGQALGRRFVRVPIPPISLEQFTEVIETAAKDLWPSIRNAIRGLYGAHLASARTALGPALFLRMPQYLRAGMPSALKDSPEPENMPQEVVTLIAEAYLINVGTWVARLDDGERNQLGARITKDFKALADSEWQWVTQLSSSLG